MNRQERREAQWVVLETLRDRMISAADNIRRLSDPEFDGDFWINSDLGAAWFRSSGFNRAIINLALTAVELRKLDLRFELPPEVLLEVERRLSC